MFACVRLQSIFGCHSCGVNVRERVLGRLKVSMMQQCRGIVPAAAWILFCHTDRGRLAGCLDFIYQAGESRKQFKTRRQHWKAQFGWSELFWLCHIWQDDSVFFFSDSFGGFSLLNKLLSYLNFDEDVNLSVRAALHFNLVRRTSLQHVASPSLIDSSVKHIFKRYHSYPSIHYLQRVAGVKPSLWWASGHPG